MESAGQLRVGGGGRGKHVVDIYFTDERGPYIELAGGCRHLKAAAARGDFEMLDVEVTGGQAVRENCGAFFVCEFEQLAAVFVIGIEDRGARGFGAAAFEQKPLGAEVIVHGAVVVEMIAREVGEDGDVEGDSEYALLREGVRGDFHYAFGDAEGESLGEELIELKGLGRGVGRGKNFAGDMIFDGADENGFAGGGVEDGFDDKGGGAFSVGACDAGIGDALGGTLVEICAEAGEGAAAVRHLRQATAGRGFCAVESVTIATAPAAMAWSMKRLPSLVSPFMATKTVPGWTRRES